MRIIVAFKYYAIHPMLFLYKIRSQVPRCGLNAMYYVRCEMYVCLYGWRDVSTCKIGDWLLERKAVFAFIPLGRIYTKVREAIAATVGEAGTAATAATATVAGRNHANCTHER